MGYMETTTTEGTMTRNQQIISLFPLRHRHDGCMRPLIRSSIQLERKRRDRGQS